MEFVGMQTGGIQVETWCLQFWNNLQNLILKLKPVPNWNLLRGFGSDYRFRLLVLALDFN